MTDIQLLWLALAGILVLNVAFFLHKRKHNKEIMASMAKHLMEDFDEKNDRIGQRDTLSDRIRDIEREHGIDPHLAYHDPIGVFSKTFYITEDGMSPTRKELKGINRIIYALLSHLKMEAKVVPSKPEETKLVKVKT